MSGGFSASYKQLAGSPVVVAAMLEETRSALKFTKMCKYWGSKRCLGWKFVFVDWCDFFFYGLCHGKSPFGDTIFYFFPSI